MYRQCVDIGTVCDSHEGNIMPVTSTRAPRHQAAQDTLLDRTLLRVDGETYDRFVIMLDSPPQPNEKLRKLMQTKAPWD